MSIGKLSAIAVKQAKPAEKPYKMTDGGGMYLLVDVKGGKFWRMDYRFAGKRKTLAMGAYPANSLAEARAARDKARKLLEENTDPGMVKMVEKLTAHHKSAHSFEAVAREWHGKFTPNWTAHTAKKNLRILGCVDNHASQMKAAARATKEAKRSASLS